MMGLHRVYCCCCRTIESVADLMVPSPHRNRLPIHDEIRLPVATSSSPADSVSRSRVCRISQPLYLTYNMLFLHVIPKATSETSTCCFLRGKGSMCSSCVLILVCPGFPGTSCCGGSAAEGTHQLRRYRRRDGQCFKLGSRCFCRASSLQRFWEAPACSTRYIRGFRDHFTPDS